MNSDLLKSKDFGIYTMKLVPRHQYSHFVLIQTPEPDLDGNTLPGRRQAVARPIETLDAKLLRSHYSRAWGRGNSFRTWVWVTSVSEMVALPWKGHVCMWVLEVGKGQWGEPAGALLALYTTHK